MTATCLPLPDRPAGVMFHHFHGGDYPVSQGSISANDLESMIESISLDRILSAQEWLGRSDTGALRPGDLCLTFDDNLLCQYKIAVPVMRKYDLTGFFFVYTSVNQGAPERLEIYRHFRTVGFPDVDTFYDVFFEFVSGRREADEVAKAVKSFMPESYLPDYSYLSNSDKTFRFVRDRVLGRERYEDVMDAMLDENGFEIESLLSLLWMNDSMLQELHSEGHVIGLHSHTHPTLIEALPIGEQRNEYQANMDHLAQILGERPRAMSHPNNSYSQETLGLLKDMGITTGFRANMTKPKNPPLELPRHNHALVHRAVQERAA